uniref:Uncharacterized protein n=1 Tax=Myotis myotis TaxID=51298 RepID=A0A7J7SRD3_MYOMY|nr:hypothetical protein mMyoMyo1_009299 [Myotis myotis]
MYFRHSKGGPGFFRFHGVRGRDPVPSKPRPGWQEISDLGMRSGFTIPSPGDSEGPGLFLNREKHSSLHPTPIFLQRNLGVMAIRPWNGLTTGCGCGQPSRQRSQGIAPTAEGCPQPHVPLPPPPAM